MRARLATATALLLALPLCTAATATKPKPTTSRCGMADPTGDVYVATPAAKVPGDHLDITCFDLAFGRHALTTVIRTVSARPDAPTDVRFQLEFTIAHRVYVLWDVPVVRDEVKNEYRATMTSATMPASWGQPGTVTKVRLTLFESVAGSHQPTARRDDAAWR